MVPDWVLREAEKRCGLIDAKDGRRSDYDNYPVFRALCDMILAHEQPPVDPIEAAAREGCARSHEKDGFDNDAAHFRSGRIAVENSYLDCAIAAIKVWIERGEGK